MGAKPESLLAAVRSLYETYPYPARRSFSVADSAGFHVDCLNFALRRRAGERIPHTADVWVAGCGTLQAIGVALRFPLAKILATDVSQASLDLSAAAAQRLGLTNLTFRREDLLRSKRAAKFDIVFCTGVLHHLPEPATGLARLVCALRPRGVAVLLLYNARHRRPLTDFQGALALLGGRGTPRKRRALAEDLARAIRESRLEGLLASYLRDHAGTLAADASLFADVLLQPHEISYEPDELFALVDGAGLRFAGWVPPTRWQLADYLNDAALLRRFATLSFRDQVRTVQHVAGEHAPYFMFHAEKARTPELAPYSAKELAGFHYTTVAGHADYTVSAGAVSGPRIRRTYQTRDGATILTPFAEGAMESYLELAGGKDELLLACIGGARGEEVVRRLEGRMARAEVLHGLRELATSSTALLHVTPGGATMRA